MKTKKTPPGGKTASQKTSAKSKRLIEKGKTYFTYAVKPREVILDRGKGARVWDLDGNDYLDLGAGIAVNGFGHQDPDLMKALMKQAKKLWHVSNVYYTEPSILLAEELVRASKFAKRVFFSNSGGEANEAAIKLARKYAADMGRPPERREIITFTGSFHGRTMATVTATAQPKYHAGFEPLPPGFVYCPFNDFGAIESMVSDKTCAVMLEVVQGEGGITPAKPGFVKHVQELCRKHDALLILDQIQDGMGRTGHLFSHFAEEGVTPDIVTLAKALGGGFPIGACLIGERAAETFQFGSHGTTFGGNPLAASVAHAALKKLQSKALMKNVQARGKELRDGLAHINKELGIFTEIRGRGLMIGAQLTEKYAGKAGEINDAGRRHGVLFLQAGPNVLRFLPPLTITQKELAEGLRRTFVALKSYIMQAG
jgi:acetylornithine/N-succinyldiaminopimelate aminotransferase